MHGDALRGKLQECKREFTGKFLSSKSNTAKELQSWPGPFISSEWGKCALKSVERAPQLAASLHAVTFLELLRRKRSPNGPRKVMKETSGVAFKGNEGKFLAFER